MGNEDVPVDTGSFAFLLGFRRDRYGSDANAKEPVFFLDSGELRGGGWHCRYLVSHFEGFKCL